MSSLQYFTCKFSKMLKSSVKHKKPYVFNALYYKYLRVLTAYICIRNAKQYDFCMEPCERETPVLV